MHEDDTRASRDMIVKLTEQVPGVVFQFYRSPAGAFCFPFVSSAIRELYEVASDDAKRTADAVFQWVHPADYELLMHEIEASARTLKPFHLEYRVVLPIQGLQWHLCDARPERQEDGGTLWHGIASNITGRKQAEDELQNLRTAVDQSAHTIVVTNPAGEIEYVNPAFEQSTGYAVSEALGKNPKILKSGGQDAAFYARLWGTISSGKIWRGQFRNRRKDGTFYWESATISPVLNAKKEIVHYIAIKENITDRISLEANLLEALDRAEAASHAKSDFLAVMSHELRTPLNGVLGFAELLATTPLDEEQQEYVETITSSGNHLLDVVNDILDFSSIEKGKLAMDSEPVALREIVEAATVAARQVARDKKLEFRCEIGLDVPDEILGDGRRIRQVLINLLGNAVKFTAQGAVELRVSAKPGSEQLEFVVEDTGPGISEGLRELLFEPFIQEDSTLRRAHEGTGLGLAISQRLAKAMGGLISVTSLEGEGSTFTFQLPLAQPEGKGFPAADPVQEPAFFALDQEVRILVVEDDSTNALLAGKMLTSLAYVPEFATHGREALDAWAPGKFAAILMDMRMPVMDGLEATRKIRERERGTDQHVPIIALTANVMPGDSDRCLEAGMDEFLSKPFTREALASKLAAALMSLK